MASTVQIEIPDRLEAALGAVGYGHQRLLSEAGAYVASGLFARRALSLGQAAELARMTLWEFIPFLSAQGISVRAEEESEIQAEIAASRQLLVEPPP